MIIEIILQRISNSAPNGRIEVGLICIYMEIRQSHMRDKNMIRTYTSPFISYASKTSASGSVAWSNGMEAL